MRDFAQSMRAIDGMKQSGYLPADSIYKCLNEILDRDKKAYDKNTIMPRDLFDEFLQTL